MSQDRPAENLRLYYMHEPSLREKSKEVATFGPEEAALVQAMAELMISHRGVGLAAPQIGSHKRIIVIHPSLLPEGADAVLINPEVVTTSEDDLVEEEGCLSLLSVAAELRRPAQVNVRYVNTEGRERDVEAEGFGARALLHEIDHLDGVLFIDRLSRLKRKVVEDRFKKLYKEFGLDKTCTPLK